MKLTAAIALTVLFVIVTFIQRDFVFAGVISLGTSSILLFSSPVFLREYWNPQLLGYWLASAVWIGVGLWLIRAVVLAVSGMHRATTQVSRNSVRSNALTRNAAILGIITVIATTSPFLIPVDPDVQGNLITTRLLPPLATGNVREYVDPGNPPEDRNSLEAALSSSTNFLLRRLTLMSGGRDTSRVGNQYDGMRQVRDSRIVFLFGTDDNGRDVFSRVISGARISLGIGICAALGSLIIGAGIGFAAGMKRGYTDAVLMRLTDLFLAIPSLFLVIGVLAFVGQSVSTLILVLAVSGWMGIARIIRGETVSLREREFILAAQMLHVSPWQIVVRHLAPNLAPILVTSTVLQFANAVLGEAALGFLGLGIQPPTATWGNMMGEATRYLASGWWVGVFPGMLLSIMLVLVHSMGERSVRRREHGHSVFLQ